MASRSRMNTISRDMTFRLNGPGSGAFADRASRCIAPSGELRGEGAVKDLAKRLDRPVVLVGLMGVGKSTVGRRLAKRLGLPFIDSDSEIEDASGYSAAEVFERYCEGD